MAKLWPLLLLAFGWPLVSHAACSDTRINAAGFSVNVRPSTTQTISDQALQRSGRLYFYADFQLSHHSAIIFQWYHNGKGVQTTQLQASQGNWRGWTAYLIDGDAAGQWKVVAKQPNGCVITAHKLAVTATYPLLHKARQLISAGDVVGAKLQLKKALNKPNSSRADKARWTHFMATNLVLAEAKSDIKQQRFLAAKGRLQSLKGKLDAPLEKQRQALLIALNEGTRAASQSTLFGLIAAIDVLSNTAACPSDRQSAVQLLNPLLDQPPHIAAFSKSDNQYQLTLTLPGGAQQQLTGQCRNSILSELWEKQLGISSGQRISAPNTASHHQAL